MNKPRRGAYVVFLDPDPDHTTIPQRREEGFVLMRDGYSWVGLSDVVIADVQFYSEDEAWAMAKAWPGKPRALKASTVGLV